MRLFIAIPIPQALHQYCNQMQNQFKGLKKTSDFHITLQFLGDEIGNPEPIIQALNKIEWQPFEIEMGDVKPFGPNHAPRGIWIACKESKKLNQLAEKIRKTMKPLGFVADYPFRAHVTLGRYKNMPTKTPENVAGMPHRFKVDHFELIQSHLGPNGPHYETLQKFK